MNTRRFRRCVATGAALVALAAAFVPGAAHAATPGYVSLLFGRMQWVSTTSSDGGLTCNALPNTVTLGQAHDDLAARGLTATGVVITSRTPETGFQCFKGYTLHPGWDLLADWHTQGWSFVSGGTHADMRTLDYEGMLTESCGSIGVFRDHGIDPTGLFGYGNNSWTVGAQTDPVSRCYAFGRRYGGSVNLRTDAVAPWFQSTESVSGGLCADPLLACSVSAGGATTLYASPDSLAAQVAAPPDTWGAVQFYRFVTGSYAGSSSAWDCTSPDWRQHWTTKAELYCYDDFLTVADAIAAAKANAVVAADPVTVAAAWGRTLDVPAPGVPRATTTAVSCPQPGAGEPATCTATITDVADGVPLAPGGIDAVVWTADGPGGFSSTTCTPAGVRPATTCAVTFAADAGVSDVGVSASYLGSADHAPSQGSAAVVVVTPRETATSVSCPTSGMETASLSCTATVTDIASGTAVTPGGDGAVSWSADAGGSFVAATCTPLGTGASASCSTSFTPALGTAGTVHVGAAYAGDAFHLGSTATPVAIAVVAAADTTSPTVQLTNPLDGATVPAGGRVTIRALASDNDRVVDVRFYVAGTLRCTDSVAPYTCPWRPAKKLGVHIAIEAIARDPAGNQASHRITVTTV